MKTDINDHFSYLENLKDNEEFQKFFDTIEDLDQEVRSHYSKGSKEEFREFLELNKGSVVAEGYKILSQRIQMEKFAPIKSKEGIDELLKAVVNLYSQI